MLIDSTFNNFRRLSYPAAFAVHSSLSSHPAANSISICNTGMLCLNEGGHTSGNRNGSKSKKGDAMLKYIALILSVSILTGCSEFKLISSAAMREISAEGMNVEQISYNYNQKLVAREKSGGAMMAKAEGNRVARDGNAAGGEKRIMLAKVKRVRGLWEKGSK